MTAQEREYLDQEAKSLIAESLAISPLSPRQKEIMREIGCIDGLIAEDRRKQRESATVTAV